MIRNDSDRRPIRLASGRVAALLLAVWCVGCASVGPPTPETGYQARGTIEIKDPSAANPVLVRFVEYYRTGKRRREPDLEEAAVWIDRPDLRVTWILNPKRGTFKQYPISGVERVIEPVPDPFGPRTRAHFEWLGSEVLEGVDADKFEVKGDKISGYAWLTHDRVPLRFSGTLEREGSSVEVRIEYAVVERDLQANHLFEIPMDYAGYENRKQKATGNSSQADDAARSLKEQQWGTPTPPAPPFSP